MVIRFINYHDLPLVLPGFRHSHLTALFGNAIENAFHAVSNLEAKQRKINIRVNFDGYSLLYEMRNYYKEAPDNHHGQGIGIKNMDDIVRIYDGRIEAVKDNEKYLFTVMLQAKEIIWVSK